MSNVSRWSSCPSQWCRECCASESIFSSSSKFKCILKDSSELPTGRTCTGLSKRNSQPHQSKVDCEFTSLDGKDPHQLLGKCSKKAKCCCPRSQLASLQNVRPVKSSAHPNQFCVSQETAEAWGDLKEFKHSNGMTERFMSVGNPYDVSNINLCGFFFGGPGKAADQGERGARYSRIVFLSGGRYLTDLEGLVQVGSDYECPDDQIASRKGPLLICSC